MEMDYKAHFKKVEQDFQMRLAEEERKQKEDEVRSKALGDPSITYEQYSELLKGAHLKPIKKGEKAEITQVHKRTVTYTDLDS